jgi:hypothetical protein
MKPALPTFDFRQGNACRMVSSSARPAMRHAPGAGLV